MPGPISDNYDPEFGTAEKAKEISDSLHKLYEQVTAILGGKPPIDIKLLVSMELPKMTTATLSERDWRLIRYALHVAIEGN